MIILIILMKLLLIKGLRAAAAPNRSSQHSALQTRDPWIRRKRLQIQEETPRKQGNNIYIYIYSLYMLCVYIYIYICMYIIHVFNCTL